MATVTLTFPANIGANSAYETGSQLRKLSRIIAKAAAQVPDKVPSGADTTLLIDNTTASGSPGFITLTYGGAATTYRI